MENITTKALPLLNNDANASAVDDDWLVTSLKSLGLYLTNKCKIYGLAFWRAK